MAVLRQGHPFDSAGWFLGGALVVFGFGVAAGALPLDGAVGIGIGVPLLVLSLREPRICIALLALSIPFSSWTKVSLGAYDVSSTDVLVAALALGWLGRSVAARSMVVQVGPITIAALVLLGSYLLSTLTAEEFGAALKEDIKLAELITAALFAASVSRDDKGQRFIVLALLGAGSLQALVGLGQFVTGYGPESFVIGPFVRAYGNFEQPNAFAGYLAMLLPMAVMLCRDPEKRRVGVAATMIIGSAVLASMSRGAWVGVGLALVTIGLMWSPASRRWLLGCAAGLVVAVGLARLGPPSVSAFTDRMGVLFESFVVFDVRQVETTPANWALVERMAHWQAGWAMAIDHPIVGVGPGNYEAAYPRYYFTRWIEPLGHAHNLYINMFAELGLIGASIFLAFNAIVLIRIGRGLRAAEYARVHRRTILAGALGAAVAFAVHNMFDNMFVHGIGVQYGLILGLAEAQLVRSVASTGSAVAHRD